MQQHCLILGGGLSGKAAERLAASLGFSTAILSDSPGLDADAAVAEADLIVTSPGMKPLVSPLWQAAMRRAGKVRRCRSRSGARCAGRVPLHCRMLRGERSPRFCVGGHLCGKL